MSNTSANGIFTFPLALSPSEKLSLYCSFHDNIRNPNELFKQMYNAAETSLALLDATKIVSINQLLTAANLAATRKIEIPSAWDLVHFVAPSNHAGHILRDFSFSEPAIVAANVIVVWIARPWGSAAGTSTSAPGCSPSDAHGRWARTTRRRPSGAVAPFSSSPRS